MTRLITHLPPHNMQLDSKCVKFSKKRLVTYGDEVELYSYGKPYSYNWAPEQSGEKMHLEGECIERRVDHLHRTRTNLRRLVTANATAFGCMPQFVTYTFATNMTDLRETHHLFDNAHKRLRRTLNRSLKYICVPEFQKRGAVHYHVVYFNIPFMEGLHKILETEWSHGFVWIQSVRDIRHVGAYISKYISADFDDSRMVGEKAFFTSRGLERPHEIRNETSIDKFLDGAILESVATKTFISERYGTITYTQYKKTTS